MIPIVYNSRTEISGGLWTSKLAGEFEEGDPSHTRFYVEGKVEVKELSGHLKLFFSDVKLVERKFVISDADRQAIVEEEAAKLLELEKKRVESADVVWDPDDETPAMKAKRYAQAETNTLAIIRTRKEVFYPQLYCFLSKKRPKKRMTDVHKTGARIYIHADVDGLFGRADSIGNFQASLKDTPDVLNYQGLVVCKLPQDEPKTEEPVIYGLIKFVSARTVKIKSMSAMKFHEVMDDMSKILTSTPGGGDSETAVVPVNSKGNKTAAPAPAPVVAPAGNKKKASDCLKPNSYYRYDIYGTLSICNNNCICF